jgi:DNA-binding transcriptional LysR family regulator
MPVVRRKYTLARPPFRIVRKISFLTQADPKVVLDVSLDDRLIDFVRENFDAAIRLLNTKMYAPNLQSVVSRLQRVIPPVALDFQAEE